MPIGIDGHVWAGARTAVYRSPFLWLKEAANPIARQLASANPTRYPDEASALDNARKQLVRALFDGAVHSEGVRWWGPPGAEDPSELPPVPEPDEWEQIDAGWWSHERFESYVVRHRQTELEFLLLRPEGSTEEWVPELPMEQVLEGANVLDIIIVSWVANALDFKGFEGDQGYVRVRVRRADIEAHFGIETAELHQGKIGYPEDAPATCEMGQLSEAAPGEKRKTRPASVSTALYDWLDEQLQNKGPDWIKGKSNPWLARRYSETVPTAVGDADYIRKVIPVWRRKHGLNRPTKPKK
jgi:hypothetical protein